MSPVSGDTVKATHGVRETAAFRPAWWCRSAHAQTLWPYLFRTDPRPLYARERIELADGDFVDIDWYPGEAERANATVLILHGLEGSSKSHYIRGLTHHLAGRGYRCAIVHFRGCSGEPNRLPIRYHSGFTDDIERISHLIAARFPAEPLFAVGFSLGANVLLKWLGERGAEAPLRRAAAVSVPFNLAPAADRMATGFSRIYQTRLLHLLKRATHAKAHILRPHIDVSQLDQVATLREFDDRVTAPLHGFLDANDYYHRASCRQFLPGIETETLILHALDDPLMHPCVVPEARELGTRVTLEVSRHGGHVGFVSGLMPGRSRFWTEQRIGAFFTDA